MCVCVCVCVCVFVRVYMCVCVCVCVQAGVHHICEYFISCIALAYVSLVSFVVFLLHCKDISFPKNVSFPKTMGHIRANENVFLPQVKIPIHYLIHIPPLRIGEILGK